MYSKSNLSRVHRVSISGLVQLGGVIDVALYSLSLENVLDNESLQIAMQVAGSSGASLT